MGRLRVLGFLSAVIRCKGESGLRATRFIHSTANKLAALLIVALMLAPSLLVMINTDTAFGSDRARIGSLDDLPADSYFFHEYILDPGVPKLGEEQIFSIWARRTDGISQVTATVSNGRTGTSSTIYETVELELVEGTVEEGRWQGSWIVKYTPPSDPSWYAVSYPYYYQVSFRAWDNEGIEGPHFSILGVLSRDGTPPEFVFEPEHEFDPAISPSSEAWVYSVSGSKVPNPKECFFDPMEFWPGPSIGDMQVIGIYYEDSTGVQAVTATYLSVLDLWGNWKKQNVDLKLVRGTPQAGYWMGALVIKYPLYDLDLYYRAYNTDGDSSSLALNLEIGGGQLRPIIGLNSATIDFNSVIVGQASSQQAVTVSNTGTANLLVGTITLTGTNANQFAIASDTASNQTIAAGASRIVNVTFNPTATGAKSANLSIPSNDPVNNPATVALSGTVTQPGISISPPTLGFGSILVGQTGSRQAVTVSNTGTADLTVGTITLTGTHANQFAIASDNASSQTIAPGASRVVNVTFNPTATGAKSATLSIPSDDPVNNPATVALSGTGTQPGISVSPPTLGFGSILVGQASSQKAVTVSNSGTASLLVGNITLTGTNADQFAIASDTASNQTIAAGASGVVNVTFTPSSTGAKSADLSIPSDDPVNNLVTVALSGTGSRPGISISPPTLGFGSILVGQASSQKAVTVSNTGTVNLSVGAITLTGANATQFTIASDTASNQTIAAGASRIVNVTFNPTTTGATVAALSILSDDPVNNPVTVSLSGTGVTAVTTGSVNNISANSAKLQGSLNALGTSSSYNVSFQYGIISDNYSSETPVIELTKPDDFDYKVNDLAHGTTYYYRAKAVGNDTAYGEEGSFTTSGQPINIPTLTDSGTLTIESDGGNFTAAIAVPAGSLPNLPGGYSFQHGLCGFTISDIEPGATVTITMTFPQQLPSNIQYWKYQPSRGWFQIPITSRNGNVITIQITDGGLGDTDGLANGIIEDPGGVAIPITPTPTPTPTPVPNLPNPLIGMGTPATHGSSVVGPAATTQPMQLPNIQIQSASISETKVAPGTPVTVTANIANRGTVNGTTRVKVYVNGEEDSSQGVTVESGGSRSVQFTVSRSQPGTYDVYIGGTQAGSFIVESSSDSDIILWLSMACVLAALIMGAIMLWRRQREYY